MAAEVPAESANDIVIHIDWINERGDLVPARRLDPESLREQTDKAMNVAIGVVRVMATRLTSALREAERDLMPNEAEIEFGVRFDSETGAAISPVFKVGGGAHLVVRYKWQISIPEQAKVLVTSDK